MATKKQNARLKVEVNFTPAEDWDIRLKKVLTILLSHSKRTDTENELGQKNDDKKIV